LECYVCYLDSYIGAIGLPLFQKLLALGIGKRERADQSNLERGSEKKDTLGTAESSARVSQIDSRRKISLAQFDNAFHTREEIAPRKGTKACTDVAGGGEAA
jgi:hypothetical protein